MFSTIPSPVEARHAAFEGATTDGMILKALNDAVSNKQTEFELHGSESFVFAAYSRLLKRGYEVHLLRGDDVQGIGYCPLYLRVSF